MKIVMSIKLPNLSILDFEMDKNSNYVSLLTSEGEVKIYDLVQVERSDREITNERLKNTSRCTISYHEHLPYVTLNDFESEIKNYSVFIPEEGLTSKDSIKLKDIVSREFNTSKKFDKSEFSKYTSPEKGVYGLFSNQKPLSNIYSSRE